jgi:CrcB protein
VVPQRRDGLDGRELLAVFCGGALGAIARVWLGRRFETPDGTWPWTTLAINVTGAFVLAYAATRLQERLPQSVYRRPFIGTGFCGAYTTFSTMQVELLRMFDADRIGLALAYAVVSALSGFAAIWLASALVRRVGRIA